MRGGCRRRVDPRPHRLAAPETPRLVEWGRHAWTEVRIRLVIGLVGEERLERFARLLFAVENRVRDGEDAVGADEDVVRQCAVTYDSGHDLVGLVVIEVRVGAL